MFEINQIPFECYISAFGAPKKFDIHFGSQTDFQDLYIVVAILKNFECAILEYVLKK